MMWNKFKKTEKRENNNIINVSTSQDTLMSINYKLGRIEAKLENVEVLEKRVNNHEERIKNLENICNISK